MATKDTRTALILREFYDVGTGNIYEAGDTVDLDPGTFDNYAAGGLVRDPKAKPDDAPAPTAAS